MPPEDSVSLGEAAQIAQRALAAAGIEDAAREARLVVSAASGLPTGEIIVRPKQPLGHDVRERFEAMLARRCANEPLSRILGEREFYGRLFALSPATLDPRPDSETLIEAVLAIAEREGWTKHPIRILDVGTGTGCLLLTLLSELPMATGLGTDVSEEALDTATRNAASLGLAKRAAFARHDALDGVEGAFDLIISNPPYIPSGEIPGLSPAVRDFDPRAALDGGEDGLSIYRRIAAGLDRILKGWVVLEVGAGQADAVASVLQQEFVKTREAEVCRYLDLGGHTRCVAMRLQS